MRRLVLSKQQGESIRLAAETTFPDECCGLLIGQSAETITVSEVVPAENLADSGDRFLVDPQVQFEWLRKLRGTEQSIVGHYHSHPNGLAELSPTDISSSMDSHRVWLIAPIEDGHLTSLKAFISGADPKEFFPIPVEIA